MRSQFMTERSCEHSLVLNDPYPARPLPVARAQPDVVRVREPDLERAVRTQAGRVRKLVVQPRAQLLQARLRVLVRDGPFCRVLGVLSPHHHHHHPAIVMGDQSKAPVVAEAHLVDTYREIPKLCPRV